MRKTRHLMGAFGVCLTLATALVAAERATSDNDAVDKLVRQALEAELAGGSRAEPLMQALALDPDNKQARWQLGFVRIGDQWVKVDDVPKTIAKDEDLAAYRQKRDALVDTADHQRELARWCKRHGLAGEARVHWTKLLEFEPEDAEALAALGLTWHDGRLLSQSQIAAEREQAVARRKTLQKYRPIAGKWRAALIGSDREQADQARQEMLRLNDPAALAAIESVFVGDKKAERRLDLALVELAAGMKGPEATDLLVRRALASDNAEAVEAACKALEKRPMYAYVPQLLAQMPGKTASKFSIYITPDGNVIHDHEVSYRAAGGTKTLDYESNIAIDPRLVRTVTPRATANEVRKAALIEERARKQEETLGAKRKQITRLLERTTGFEDPDDPELWNKRYAEYYGWAEPKPEPEQRFTVTENVSFQLPPPAPPHECFPAGTLVETQDGPTAIETIQPGDRVLSQDMTSGELAYKTVQKRTLRSSVRLVRVHLGDRAIVATHGHPFWVVGRGWQVAGRLEAGMQLRGLERDFTVDQVEKMPPREVYNLLVSDYGTYFVGPERLLVHDDSPPTASANAVPGLVAAKP